MYQDVPRPGYPDGPPAPVEFAPGAPLGGVQPTEQVEPERSDRRELALTAVLLVLSIVAGATSLMPWRDFGRRIGAPVAETGWVRPDGSLGRGWVAVVLAVLIAGAGVLIAADRSRLGRVLAVLSGMALAGLAVGEWGLGEPAIRTGPGPGLWVGFVTGALVVAAVGILSPEPPGAHSVAPRDGGPDER